ncbi:hypothetical protein Xoosp13_156 [Xanthomonas phage Xoo-sp13]|nr:hypothetical protein Xoosp13_156 [Xanthomonas phage Xoo-sp13]
MNSFKLLINFIEQCKLHSGNGRYIATNVNDIASFADVSIPMEVKITESGISIEKPAVSYLSINWDRIPEKYKREIVDILTEDELDKQLERELRSFFT